MLILVPLLLFGAPSVAQAQDMDGTLTGCPTTANFNACLTTYQDGVGRRGYNPKEATLTQTAIGAMTGHIFTLLHSVAVNGPVYAQPLILPKVTIGTTNYNRVIYAVTNQDWIYAINGDDGTVIASRNLLSGTAYSYLDATDVSCTDIKPAPGDIGILSTPVIDIKGNDASNGTITSGTIYLVARYKTTTGTTIYYQTLYAIDITSATLASKASIAISATVNGFAFDTLKQNQRGALLAVPIASHKPQVFIPWGSHCDHGSGTYAGFLMAYQLNDAETSLSQSAAWVTVPSDSGHEGGIWEGGAGPAMDNSRNVYFAVGNGHLSVNGTVGGMSNIPPNDNPTSCSTTPCDYGNSFLKLAAPTNGTFTPSVLDFFTPHDQSTRNSSDLDFGSGGSEYLPQSTGIANPFVQAGKEGTIYLMNASTGSLGGYDGGTSDHTLQALTDLCDAGDSECGVWGSPAWWTTTSGGGSTTGYAYWGPKNLPIRQYLFTPGTSPTLGTGYVTQTVHSFDYPGPEPTVSSPSSTSTGAIVWAVDQAGYSTERMPIYTPSKHPTSRAFILPTR